MTEDQQNVPHADEVTSKYKRLLSLAKSNLESNQSLMAEKDKQISQLKQQMEEMKSSKFGNRRPSTMPSDDGQAAVPRQILRNIAVNGKIWVLLEFSGLSGGDSWKLFNNEQELDDFISRQSGPPLIKPHLCLTVEESTRIMEEAKRKLDTVVEEFRRYKVRTEVLRKQKEGEKVVNTNNLFPGLGGFGINRTSPGRGSLLSAEFDNMEDGGSDTINNQEIARLTQQLEDQETKWRFALDRVQKENELLKHSSGETVLATQWRERYDRSIAEKEILQEKLKIVMSHGSGTAGDARTRMNSHGHADSSVNGDVTGLDEESVTMKYLALMDEYKEYQHQMALLDRTRQQEYEELRLQHILSKTNTSNKQKQSKQSPNHRVSNTAYDGYGANSENDSLESNKISYVRNMVLQYLSCKDPMVKQHIESALVVLFRYSPEEHVVAAPVATNSASSPFAGWT